MPRTIRRGLAALATSLLAAAALAAPASAGLLVKSATGCVDTPLTKPFSQWGDRANYRLVPGGSFEGGATGWQLTGGARVVSGNEPFKVHGSADKTSLLLPAGSSATSPTVCVGLGEPTLRYFDRRSSGLLTTLAVWVQVETSLGLVVTLPVLPGDLLGGGSWHPSLIHPLLVNLLPLLPNQRTPVRFRFTPILFGSWTIDDVYVDPFRMR